MCSLIFFVILIIGYGASDEETLIQPCHTTDLKCMTVLLRQFARGFPKQNIEPADPFYIPELIIENEGLLITLNSINVTGFSQQTVTEFLTYPDGNSKKMTLAIPLEISAEVNFKTEKPTTGHYYMKAVITGVIGPITISGEQKNKPEAKLTLNRDLKATNFNGDDKVLRQFEESLNKEMIKKVVPAGIYAMMRNMAALKHKLSPKMITFFSNISDK